MASNDVFVLTSWFNPAQDTEICGVFDSETSAKNYIAERKMNEKYCDISKFRVQSVLGKAPWEE